MKFSVGHCRDGDGRKTCRGARLDRCARELAFSKSRSESLIRGHSCTHGAVRYTRRDSCSANGAKKSSLEGRDVGRIHANDIGDGTRQDIAEDAESGTQYGLGFQLPGDCSSRLQDGKRRRGEYMAETGLNRGVQWLIHIMGNRIERAP